MISLALAILSGSASMHRHWHTLWFLDSDSKKLAAFEGGRADGRTGGRFGRFTIKWLTHNNHRGHIMLRALLANGDKACVQVEVGSSWGHYDLDPSTNFGFSDEYWLDAGWLSVQEGVDLPATCPPLPQSVLDGFHKASGTVSTLRVRRLHRGKTTLAGSGTWYSLAYIGSDDSWQLNVLDGSVYYYFNEQYTTPCGHVDVGSYEIAPDGTRCPILTPFPPIGRPTSR